jgi:hypothetical protein
MLKDKHMHILSLQPRASRDNPDMFGRVGSAHLPNTTWKIGRTWEDNRLDVAWDVAYRSAPGLARLVTQGAVWGG